MPFDLAGISNENEFYSEHYLTTVFEGDVEETFSAWRQAEKEGTTPPNRRLARLGTTWQALRARYLAERGDRQRLLISREFADRFLDVLGYERRSTLMLDAEDKLVPVLARRALPTGEDQVWIVEVPSPGGEDFETDPLQIRFRCEQFENIETARDVAARRKDTAEVAVTRGVFGLTEPPRFVILLSLSQAVLIDRRKWSDSRLLRFRFGEIFDRADDTTIGVTTALLAAESLSPGAGTPLIDRIDEESHRHAYGVSQDLKFALRKAIEVLGNEASDLIVTKRRANKEGVFSGENLLDAGRLTTECLRYMYRLLFLFFIEARPELGFAPMKAKAYRTGYSLESLRELELVPLETDEDREGHYISDTLDALFALVFEGTPGARRDGEAFTFHPVRARLFDPASIGTYLRGLRFRNEAMQEIIELLSLSKGDRGQGRGRISYAQLGISQLGAVYESLLSFSGFFATEDLLELKPAGKATPGPLEAAFFTPKRRAGDFIQGATDVEGEFVYEGTTPRIYSKGTFIYRLSGRNRENSASYYTPEPLARIMVKYALKELLVGKKADDILQLKVVEPAMGSAAFLVEVVNQLADRYLDLKQAEVGRRIPHETYAYERQRVRAFLADRNVFGVDLNPIAVELGQVSLWLNCLHAGGFAPWFEDQVHTGNSLVGARRATFPISCLTSRKEEDRWYKRKPREIGWSGAERASDEVWHFLLPDPGMCAYDVNIVRPLAPEEWKIITEWRRDFVGPLSKDEVATVQRLSHVIDALFVEVADRLRDMRAEVNDELSIWPVQAKADERHVDFSDKIGRLATFHGDGARNSVAWRRLRAAMDAWCSLWFWPVDKASLLPSRTKFLQDLDLVLTQGVNGQSIDRGSFTTGSSQGRLFETVSVPAKEGSGSLFGLEERATELNRDDLFGEADIDKLMCASPWLPTAMSVASTRRFMHFDLEFADVMRDRGGFDLVVGNPPWLKPIWEDADILSEQEPAFGIREVSASDVAKQRVSILDTDERRINYLSDYVGVAGLQAAISSLACSPFTAKGQPNLYKSFIDLSFRLYSKDGVTALVHQDNHLSEPDGDAFRSEWYRRIRRHYNFRNAITKKLFAEVSDRRTFSINIYGQDSEVGFDHIATLLLPEMIDGSYEHDGIGAISTLKHAQGGWNTRGHKKRIVRIDNETLMCFASVIEDGNATPGSTRFMFPYSTDTLAILQALSMQRRSFAEAAKPFQMRGLWGETAATRSGAIRPEVHESKKPSDVILTGPQIYVGNPFYKSPNATGSKEVNILLDVLNQDHLPRCYFSHNDNGSQAPMDQSRLAWSPLKGHTESYRIAFRKMMSAPMERTLVSALIPPGFSHVSTIQSLAFKDEGILVSALPLWVSLPYDFLVKISGRADMLESVLEFFPWCEVSDTAKHRALRLSCLTADYAAVWERHAPGLDVLPWSSDDPRLAAEDNLSKRTQAKWAPTCGLRSDFARRYALLEIDVLVAQALRLSVDQLIEMYRTQFHVFEENERGTWYDRCGRIVWTCSKGLSGVGWRKKDGKKPSGREWEEIYATMPEGERLVHTPNIDYAVNDVRGSSHVFEAPFTVCDREADYRRAWAFFAAHDQVEIA